MPLHSPHRSSNCLKNNPISSHAKYISCAALDSPLTLRVSAQNDYIIISYVNLKLAFPFLVASYSRIVDMRRFLFNFTSGTSMIFDNDIAQTLGASRDIRLTSNLKRQRRTRRADGGFTNVAMRPLPAGGMPAREEGPRSLLQLRSLN